MRGAMFGPSSPARAGSAGGAVSLSCVMMLNNKKRDRRGARQTFRATALRLASTQICRCEQSEGHAGRASPPLCGLQLLPRCLTSPESHSPRAVLT